MKLNIVELGRCDYEKALDIQFNTLEKRQNKEIEDTLILVEHPPVITLGSNAMVSNIIASEEFLKGQGIQLHKTNRGGDVTYHGPGQIVGYPIIDIKSSKIGIRNFVRNLEEVFIQLLKEEFQIEAGRHPEHTGVWVGDEKIVAIGLAVKKGVTMHGFAFNVNTNLQHFNLIVPCGIANKGVTSVEKLTGKETDFTFMNQLVTEYFSRVFDYTIGGNYGG
ncbi:lipoyl(octanoyl) transferase LipB [Alkaliphilus transvaalensis]|uniref:lipoyl(octanoyl) transferase LipB n=1 Tax=Alkaliphilus transvaalensis TaxID=114628 RepID=UPI00047A29FD|nr:lipoyl(octanoyl) transferase LipB [Alkaliphilus transvaalensis]